MNASPYLRTIGFDVLDIPPTWWTENGDWIVDEITLRFDVNDGYVIGEIADLDTLARTLWKAYQADPASRQPLRR